MSIKKSVERLLRKPKQEDGEESLPPTEKENLAKALDLFEQYLSQNPDLLAGLTDLSPASSVTTRLAGAYNTATAGILKNDFPESWEAFLKDLDNQRRDRFYKGTESTDRIQLLLNYMRIELGRKSSRTRR